MELTNEKSAIKATYFSIIGDVLLAAIKLISRSFSNSYALIADGSESTADIFSSFFVLSGFKYAQRPPDENHPFGHSRIEPIRSTIKSLN